MQPQLVLGARWGMSQAGHTSHPPEVSFPPPGIPAPSVVRYQFPSEEGGKSGVFRSTSVPMSSQGRLVSRALVFYEFEFFWNWEQKSRE